MPLKNRLRLVIFLIIFAVVLPRNLLADELWHRSISFDPIGVARFFHFLVFLPGDLTGEEGLNLDNVGLTVESNWKTVHRHQMGIGFILSSNRIALTSTYRFFRDRETQSGFFWGPFALLEWRRMYWYYDVAGQITVDTAPYGLLGTPFNSIGLTFGADVGFRFRISNFSITAFGGMGIPLFLAFGELLPEGPEFQEFYMANILPRGLRFGVRLDFYHPRFRWFRWNR